MESSHQLSQTEEPHGFPSSSVTSVTNDFQFNQSQKSHENRSHEKNPKNTKKIKNTQNIKKNIKPQKSKKSSLICANIRGLIPGTRRDKLTYLSSLASESSAEIIIVTETHLSPKISEAEINIPGWGTARCDRLERKSGGSLIYHRDQMTATNIDSFSNSYVDTTMLFTPSNESAWIALYRPPNCPELKFEEALVKIRNWILKLEEALGKTPVIFLAGDFNFPQMGSWSTSTIEAMTSNPTTRIENVTTVGTDKTQILSLISLINDWSLTQEVIDVTHGQNILDLVFTNATESIEETEVIENMVISDHAIVIARLDRDAFVDAKVTKVNFCSTSIPLYKLQGAPPEHWAAATKEFAEIEFDEEKNPEELCNDLTNALEIVVKNNFLKHAPPSNSHKKSNSYIPREARTLLKKKLNASRALKKATDTKVQESLKNKIRETEEDLRKLIHRKRSHDEKKACSDLSRNPGDLFKLIAKLTKKTEKIGPLARTPRTKDWTECEILSDQYSKVFSTPRDQDIFNDPSVFFQEVSEEYNTEVLPKFTDFIITTEYINKAIDKLPPKSAPGPDGIPNLLLKNLKFEIIPILSTIYQKSLDSGRIPSKFLNAFVKPIKKPKKQRSNPASYRPVSLTTGLSKIFEHILKVQLQNYLEDNDIITNSQHGFRPLRSCLSQLLDHYNAVLVDLENGKVADTIYLDFAKAFDSVDKYILSRELAKIGIKGKAGVWLHNFLTDRTQQILADNKISAPASVRSGVPQGTILGPLLFLIMINSLSEIQLSSRISMFADDTRLAHGVNTEDDIRKLQDDLDNVFRWQRENNMEFNSDKFQHVSHGRMFKSSKLIPHGIYLSNTGDTIKNELVVRDLGIEISASADFVDHINLTCKRARDKSAWIFRTFYSRDIKFLSFMWKSYVQPILDYGSQLWAPSKMIEIKKMEDIFKNYSAIFGNA